MQHNMLVEEVQSCREDVATLRQEIRALRQEIRALRQEIADLRRVGTPEKVAHTYRETDTDPALHGPEAHAPGRGPRIPIDEVDRIQKGGVDGSRRRKRRGPP